MDQQINRRDFMKAGAAVLMTAPASALGHADDLLASAAHWRLPLRITERAGIRWMGERVSVGVVIPSACSTSAIRLRNELTAKIIPVSAGYAGKTATGSLRYCQLSFPLHLEPKEQANLLLELLPDAASPDAIAPAPVGQESVSKLDLSGSQAGIRWQTDPQYGIRPTPTIDGEPIADDRSDWCQLAIADLSASSSVLGGYLPLAENETSKLFPRLSNPELTVVDWQRRLNRGAYSAGYDIRQIHQYDFPDKNETERPYCICDLILRVHAGADGVPLRVDGLAFLLGSKLQKEIVWQARGDAADPTERLRRPWERARRFPAGDWMLARGEGGRSMLIIPWSAYTLDGYDLSYFVGRNQTLPMETAMGYWGKAGDGLSIALASSPYKLNWGVGADWSWGRNTYEFRCRLAWGTIQESTAERLTLGYRCPPHIEVGKPERTRSQYALRWWPKRFNYTPGEMMNVELELSSAGDKEANLPRNLRLRVDVEHRGQKITTVQQDVEMKGSGNVRRGEFLWQAPDAGGGGYLLLARSIGFVEPLESAPTVLEVLRRPQDFCRAVRMATVCELYLDRDLDVLVDRLTDARINVVWIRNAFDEGQYTAPVQGSWHAGEGCQTSDIGREVLVFGSHLRQFIQGCHSRGLTVIMYGEPRAIQASHYLEAEKAGELGPQDVDLAIRAWPFPDETTYEAIGSNERWERYLIRQITDGMQRYSYDGYQIDHTSYENPVEADMVHRVLTATGRVRSDQFVVMNVGPAPRYDVPVKHWLHPRDPEIVRWPETGCVLMEQQGIDKPDDLIAYARMYRGADDTKTPVLYMNDPTRRSPSCHLLRLSHALAGKATDDLCVGNSSHDGALFLEQCPISAAFTQTLYSGFALHPELFEPGPTLDGIHCHGLEDAAVFAYDSLSAAGKARTVIIANRSGWNAPLRNVGYYWDGPKPSVRANRGVTVSVPVPPHRPILGCWLVQPEGWSQIAYKSSGDGSVINIQIPEVSELAALIIRWLS